MEKLNLITQVQENQKKDGIKVVDNKKTIMQCSKCKKTYGSKAGLKYHFSRVHEEKTKSNETTCKSREKCRSKQRRGRRWRCWSWRIGRSVMKMDVGPEWTLKGYYVKVSHRG